MRTEVNEAVVDFASRWVGIPVYKFEAKLNEAPWEVSCQTLIAWVYKECGIIVPVLLSDQLYYGVPVQSLDALEPGDWVFSKGRSYNFWDSQRAKCGVGHIGLVAGDGMVFHASFTAGTVAKDPIHRFTGGQQRFRGAYRLPDALGYPFRG